MRSTDNSPRDVFCNISQRITRKSASFAKCVRVPIARLLKKGAENRASRHIRASHPRDGRMHACSSRPRRQGRWTLVTTRQQMSEFAKRLNRYRIAFLYIIYAKSWAALANIGRTSFDDVPVGATRVWITHRVLRRTTLGLKTRGGDWRISRWYIFARCVFEFWIWSTT